MPPAHAALPPLSNELRVAINKLFHDRSAIPRNENRRLNMTLGITEEVTHAELIGRSIPEAFSLSGTNGRERFWLRQALFTARNLRCDGFVGYSLEPNLIIVLDRHYGVVRGPSRLISWEYD